MSVEMDQGWPPERVKFNSQNIHTSPKHSQKGHHREPSIRQTVRAHSKDANSRFTTPRHGRRQTLHSIFSRALNPSSPPPPNLTLYDKSSAQSNLVPKLTVYSLSPLATKKKKRESSREEERREKPAPERARVDRGPRDNNVDTLYIDSP